MTLTQPWGQPSAPPAPAVWPGGVASAPSTSAQADAAGRHRGTVTRAGVMRRSSRHTQSARQRGHSERRTHVRPREPNTADGAAKRAMPTGVRPPQSSERQTRSRCRVSNVHCVGAGVSVLPSQKRPTRTQVPRWSKAVLTCKSPNNFTLVDMSNLFLKFS